MTTITLTINEQRKPEGFKDKDKRAYARFKKMLSEAEPGEILSVAFWFPRNGKFHRLHMAMIAQLFDAQEQFEDDEQFRKWLEVGAGYCTWAPGPSGKAVPIPKSISYKSLDDEGMRDVHEKVKAFIRSPHAQNFLWPHLSGQQQTEMVELVLQGFERE